MSQLQMPLALGKPDKAGAGVDHRRRGRAMTCAEHRAEVAEPDLLTPAERARAEFYRRIYPWLESTPR